MNESILTEIRDYSEELPVKIEKTVLPKGNARWVIHAKNEGGYNGTQVDLLDVLEFVKKNMPDIWNTIR